MCRRLIYLIPFVLVLGFAGSAFAVDAEITSATTPPVIDGVKEDAWSASDGHKCLSTVAGVKPDSDADLSCNWWALWDSEYLYVFVDVKDKDLRNDSEESYEDDSIEIMVDVGNDKQKKYGDDDYQYRIAWDTRTPKIEEHYHRGKSLAGVEFAMRETDANDGYTLEIKFPWDALLKKGSTAPGDLLGFTVMINDDDDGRERDTQLAWQPDTGEAWQDPSLFGTAEFVVGLKACNPDPRNGAKGVTLGVMQWIAGKNAKSHNVYFGTDPNLPLVAKDWLKTTYEPNTLKENTTYYWRIDEVSGANLWPGDVWHFTTAPLTGKQP